MTWPGPLLLLILSALSTVPAISGGAAGGDPAGAGVQAVEFGRVTWGRNTLQLRLGGGETRAETLDVRIRAFFVDSGSGIVWEKTSPAFLAPGRDVNVGFDYWVRPDHGRLRVELRITDGARRVVHEESRELLFEAPYQGDYVLQPYEFTGSGIAWDSRIFPSFRVHLSPHFVFYYFPNSESESKITRIAAARERILEDLSEKLGVDLPTRTVFFLYPDSDLARRLTGHRGDGWTYGSTIVEVYGERRKVDPRHELVHLLASRIGAPPALFAEGLATSWERTFDNAGRYRADVDSWCRGLLREGALLSAEELLRAKSFGEDLTRPRIAYPESACFIRYLVKVRGWETVRRAYAELVSSDDPEVQARNAARFAVLFGMSLPEAESAWKQDLARSRGPTVPPAVVRSVVRSETVPYLVARGRHLLTSGSAPEAERVLREAIAIEPGDAEARFLLGQACHLRKEFAAAVEEYGWVIRLGDRTSVTQVAWSHVWSGQILELMGKQEEARKHYRTAEALGDTTEVVLEGRSTTSLEAARAALTRARGDPGN